MCAIKVGYWDIRKSGSRWEVRSRGAGNHGSGEMLRIRLGLGVGPLPRGQVAGVGEVTGTPS